MKLLTKLFITGMVYACFLGHSYAKPVAVLSIEGVVITLHDDKCKFSVQLPQRATWFENGKTFDGCFGVRPDLGLVVAYFSDGSIALIPMSGFKAPQST